jgi:hypothetical protein
VGTGSGLLLFAASAILALRPGNLGPSTWRLAVRALGLRAHAAEGICLCAILALAAGRNLTIPAVKPLVVLAGGFCLSDCMLSFARGWLGAREPRLAAESSAAAQRPRASAISPVVP